MNILVLATHILTVLPCNISHPLSYLAAGILRDVQAGQCHDNEHDLADLVNSSAVGITLLTEGSVKISFLENSAQSSLFEHTTAVTGASILGGSSHCWTLAPSGISKSNPLPLDPWISYYMFKNVCKKFLSSNAL